jgi:hypothetical protein
MHGPTCIFWVNLTSFSLQCAGIGWKNFSEEAERKMAKLYQDAYPIKFKNMVMLDSPLLIWAMMKVVMPFLDEGGTVSLSRDCHRLPSSCHA